MIKDLTSKTIRCFIAGIIFLSIVTLQGISGNRETHQIVFMLMMVSLFSLILKNIWITLFILWTVFLFSFFKFTTGSIYLSNILFGSILYFITKIVFKKEHINFFINAFLWFIFVNIVYMSVQLCGLDFIFDKVVYLSGIKGIILNKFPNGFMGHASVMGILMALAVPLLATRKSKWAWMGALGLFVPLYISKTALCLLVGIFGFLFVLYYKLSKKVWIILLIILSLLGSLYVGKVDKLGTERFVQWRRVLVDCMIHPITGWGLDSFRNITPMKDFRYMQTAKRYNARVDADGKIHRSVTHIAWWDNPHNLYISLIFEFGAIGLMLFMGYMRQNVMRFKYAVKDSNTIALAGFIFGFLIISMGHFPIFLARIAPCIICCFALYEVSTS